MAQEVILAEQTLNGFVLYDAWGVYGSTEAIDALGVSIGETYTVIWDGETYSCVAFDASSVSDGLIGLGNGSAYGLSGNDEPFLIAVWPDATNFISLTDTEAGGTHTVAIYTADESTETEETYAANDAIILSYSQNPDLYEKIPKVWLTHPSSTEEAPVLVPFTYGEAVSKTVEELDFAGGDMSVPIAEGELVNEMTIVKPADLAAENIRYGKEIAGFTGTFLGDTEETTVDLNMVDGDQVIVPSVEGKVLSQVTITKPADLLPENIAKDKVIGGVTGTFEGGSGGSATEPYVECTLNSSGAVTAVSFYGFTTIPSSFCYSWSSLTSVDFSGSPELTTIGGHAFRGCTALTEITIPEGVTSIGYCAFYGCTKLASVTLPDSLTILYGYAFYNCSALTSIALPDALTELNLYAFAGCTGLTSIVVPNAVTVIGIYAFSGCTALRTVTIGSAVAKIGYRAFYNCSKLSTATFKDTTTWYRTTSSSYSDGTVTTVTSTSTAATYLRSTYDDYYWYKT